MAQEAETKFEDWNVRRIGTFTRLTVTIRLSTGIAFESFVEVQDVLRLMALKNPRAKELLEREIRVRMALPARAFAVLLMGGET